MNGKNKQLMQAILAQLCIGNDQPLIDAMAEDMQWHWMGTGPRAKSFIGKSAVVNDLLAAAKTAIVPPAKAVVHRLFADGEYVVAECTGQNTTTEGKAYNNNYCWVCRFADGRLREINEYMDTQLVTETFGQS